MRGNWMRNLVYKQIQKYADQKYQQYQFRHISKQPQLGIREVSRQMPPALATQQSVSQSGTNVFHALTDCVPIVQYRTVSRIGIIVHSGMGQSGIKKMQKGLHPACPYCWRQIGINPEHPYCWQWKGNTPHVHIAVNWKGIHPTCPLSCSYF